MRYSVLLFPLLLCGCAGMSYVLDNYQGVARVDQPMPDDTYWVFDKPGEHRMLISSSPGSAAGQGLVQGLTLNAVSSAVPKPRYEAAVRAYLDRTDRTSCKIVDGSLIQQPEWEFKYSCVAAGG